MGKPILYSYWRSSCSWRVRMGKKNLEKKNWQLFNDFIFLALELKKIEYNYKPVHLVKDGGEQLQSDYAAINPMCQVPSLVLDNGVIIAQSMAIIEFLEDFYPNTVKLLPKDPIQRAKTREICEAINAGTQPMQNLKVMNMHSPIQEERVKWSHFWIENGLKAVEVLLSKSCGNYCIGDEITMADCFLVPQVYNANRFKVDMTQFPNINRIVRNLENLEAVVAAHPENQPDKQ